MTPSYSINHPLKRIQQVMLKFDNIIFRPLLLIATKEALKSVEHRERENKQEFSSGIQNSGRSG